MNIYLLEQNVNNDYDTYDSCVVIAETENHAKSHELAPCHCRHGHHRYCTWAPSEHVVATLIGQGKGPARRIIASFNAG